MNLKKCNTVYICYCISFFCIFAPMHITDTTNRYSPLCMDIPFAMPYMVATDIKIYYNYNNETITEIAVIDCRTGIPEVIPFGDWNYVIGQDDEGTTYNYFTNPTLPEGLGCSFYFRITANGEQYLTESYIAAFGNCTNPRRCTTLIESEYAKHDCINEKYTSRRWYGLPVVTIDGNPNLQFTNSMRVWGQLGTLAAEFEFDRFTGCTITKSEITRNYEVTAGRIAPYFVRYVEAVLGRGIVEIDGETYEVKSKSAFDKIRAYGVSQFDMNIELTDCTCTVSHDCDLEYIYTPPDCQNSLAYECGTQDYQGLIFTQGFCTLTRGTGLPANDYVSFSFPTNADAISFFNMLTIGAGGGNGNGAPTAYHTLRVTDVNGDDYCFYLPYVDDLTRVNEVVYFDYNFWFGAPLIDSLDLCGFNTCRYVETPILPIGGTATISAPGTLNMVMTQTWLDFEFTAIDTINVLTFNTTALNSLQLNSSTLRVYIPDGNVFTVTANATLQNCGEVELTVTIDDNTA